MQSCCYFKNVLQSIKQKISKSVEQIFKVSGVDEYVTFDTISQAQVIKIFFFFRFNLKPQTVTAYYSPAKNQMVFPGGLLQKPIFNDASPM